MKAVADYVHSKGTEAGLHAYMQLRVRVRVECGCILAEASLSDWGLFGREHATEKCTPFLTLPTLFCEHIAYLSFTSLPFPFLFTFFA